MPYIRPFADGYAITTADHSGAIEVSQSTIDTWDRLCSEQGVNRPHNRHGLPLRPMAAGIYNGDRVDEGVFVDWQHDTTRQFCFTARRAAVVDQPTHRWLATTFGPFQHSLQSYRAADCWARRVDRAQARGGQARDPQAVDYRRWSNRRWSPQAIAAVDRPGASNHRHFGIEIEFNHSGVALAAERSAIGREARAAGYTFVDRWGSYGRAANIAGWQGTYDSTVSGGEVISDIMVGDAASHDEVRDILRLVRQHGGIAGTSQGMHVHHDVRDFTTAERVRLVDNLRTCQTALLSYVGARSRNSWCGAMTDDQWDAARTAVAAGRAVHIGRYVAFNMARMHDRGAIEFRSLGHTLNGRKVRVWIRVGQAMMAATKSGYTFGPATTVPSMVEALVNHGGLTRWAADQFLVRTGHAPVRSAA